MLGADIRSDDLGEKNLGKWTYGDVFVLFDNVRWMECDSVRSYVKLGWETLVGGKLFVNLMLGRRKEIEIEPETTPSSLLIFESVATWIALMISRLAMTQFSSTISTSAVAYVRLWFQRQP